jgi:hypothetical protein
VVYGFVSDFGTHSEDLGVMKVCSVGVADPFCLDGRLVFLDVLRWAYLVLFLFAVWFADDLTLVDFIVLYCT